ncbi:MAG TPA: EamA family transporter [Xanthobacteraceae bacterium]|jgi:multidrug transporter EmrE-like cation transporter|nr:EamA family transporter [Xanthobacteraceae bacterium]
MSKYFSLILATVLLNATSQILMKTGMTQVGKFEFSGASFRQMTVGAATNIFIICGLVTMVISMVTHLMSLSRFDVSFAFPFLSIAYVLVLLYGYLAMGENVTALRVAGVALVVAGTVLIARS